MNITYLPFSHHPITYIKGDQDLSLVLHGRVYDNIILGFFFFCLKYENFRINSSHCNARSLWLVSLSDLAEFEMLLQSLWLLASKAHGLPTTEQSKI